MIAGYWIFGLALVLKCQLFNAIADVSAVSRCLSRQMEGKKYRQSKSKSFHLNYGDAGVEMFNAVTPKQMKEIELLAECVQDIFPRHFVLT